MPTDSTRVASLVAAAVAARDVEQLRVLAAAGADLDQVMVTTSTGRRTLLDEVLRTGDAAFVDAFCP